MDFCKISQFSCTVRVLWETMLVETNCKQKFSARNNCPFSFVFCMIKKKNSTFFNTASAMTARDITCIVSLEVKRARASTQPWQTYLPGTYELYCSKIFLKLVFIQTNSINMEITPEVMRTETPVAVAKGFLELSEETMCMLPFKAHPKGLAAYEKRLI